jgi:hypothetical protein
MYERQLILSTLLNRSEANGSKRSKVDIAWRSHTPNNPGTFSAHLSTYVLLQSNTNHLPFPVFVNALKPHAEAIPRFTSLKAINREKDLPNYQMYLMLEFNSRVEVTIEYIHLCCWYWSLREMRDSLCTAVSHPNILTAYADWWSFEDLDKIGKAPTSADSLSKLSRPSPTASVRWMMKD